MKKQKLLTLLTLLVVCVTGAWGQSLIYSNGFENGTDSWTKSSMGSATSSSDQKRTGGKSLSYACSNASGYARKSLTYTKGYYIHVIMWAKSTTNMNFTLKLNGSESSPFAVSSSQWTRLYHSINYSSTTGSKNTDVLPHSASGTFYLDDVIAYYSSSSTTDLTAPSAATSPEATTSALSWTNGSDTGTGATGIQNTLIFKRTSGTEDDLTLNNQGIYSLTATEGPSTDQSGHWTLVATIAAGTTSYEATLEEDTRYAIVHRDLAYNYSNPTYITTPSATPKTVTVTTISGGSSLNKDLKNGTAAGTLTAAVTAGGDPVGGATVTWASDDESIARVGETTGVVTLVGVGDATITATYAGDETYASSFDTYEINVTDSRTEITPSLTYDNSTLILGITTTATPTLTGNDGDGAVTYSSDATGVATVDPETGVVTAVAAGTAHITASIAAAGNYRAGSAQATITVATNPLGSKSITWSLSPIGSDSKSLTSTSNSTSIYLKNIGEINHSRVTLNDTPSTASNRTAKIDRTVGKDDEKYVYVTFDVEDGYYFIPTSIALKVANVSTVTTFDAELVDEHDVAVGETGKSFDSTGGHVEDWTINNADNSKAMSGTVTLKIYGYAETEGTYRFGNQFVISGKVVEVTPVTVSAANYATYVPTQKVDFTGTSISAYKATVVGTEVDFTQVYVVPANTGVLLYADGGASINVPVTAEDADDFTGNRLIPGDGSSLTYVEGVTEYYILANETAGVGFYKANGNVVTANKAYLDLTGTNAKSFVMPGGETDGIRSIENGELKVENSDYYNLAGQKVSKDYKGIVIVNGKKYLRK